VNSAARRILPTLAIGLASVQITAGAEDPSVADQVRRCAAEADSVHRLACYDRVATGLSLSAAPHAQPGATPGSVGTPTASTMEGSSSANAAKTAAAGAAPIDSTAPQAAEFGVSNGPLEAKRQVGKPQMMTAVVAQVTVRPHGELVVKLDNGQVWQQNEAVAYFPLKAGDKVEISVGALGSYVLWAPFRRATKVTRVY
jgi:hypothetical protein